MLDHIGVCLTCGCYNKILFPDTNSLDICWQCFQENNMNDYEDYGEYSDESVQWWEEQEERYITDEEIENHEWSYLFGEEGC